MKKIHMRFFFDWCSEACLWAREEEDPCHYPVKNASLPISDELKAFLDRLISWHDQALNWADPAEGLLWTQEQVDAFIAAAKEGYYRLCEELGPEYEIILEDKELL